MFQQAADPLPAVPDHPFGGTHQLGDASVGVAIGDQADDALVGVDGVL